MFRARVVIPAIAALLSLAAPPAAFAQPVAAEKDSTASVLIHRPASVRKLKDLSFAYLAVTGAGTATIDPNTEQMTTTGGVLHISAPPFAALFEGVAPLKGVVIIRIPKNPITVTRVGGTETMTVSDWTISGNGRRTVAAQEPFDFKVGGTLNVNAGQAEGLYTGTFAVDIQYP